MSRPVEKGRVFIRGSGDVAVREEALFTQGGDGDGVQLGSATATEHALCMRLVLVSKLVGEESETDFQGASLGAFV